MKKKKKREYEIAFPLARVGNRKIFPFYGVSGSPDEEATLFRTLDDAINYAEKNPLNNPPTNGGRNKSMEDLKPVA